MSQPIFHKPLRLAAALVATGLLSWHGAASTQTIDRMKLSDGDLSCQQIFGEIRQMEGIAAGGGAVVQAPVQAPMQAPVAAAQAPATNFGSNLLGGLLGAAQARGNVGGGGGAAGIFGNLAAGLNGIGGGSSNNQALANQLNQATSQGLGALGQIQQSPEFQREMGNVMGQANASILGAMNDPNTVRQMLLASPDPAVRAQANDPAAMQQVMAAMRSPQTQAAVNQGMGQAMGMLPNPNLLGQAQAQMQGQGNILGAIAGVQAGGAGANEQMRQLMLMSNDPNVRARANDPNAVAQYQAVMQNPNLAVAMANAQRAGVNTGAMQGAMGLLGGLQQAANGQNAQAAAPAQNGFAGLLGGLAGARGGAGGQQAAGLLGGLLGGGQAAAPVPAPAPIAMQAAAPVAMAAPAGGGAARAAQANARKEHLTSLFLTKGCRLSEVNR